MQGRSKRGGAINHRIIVVPLEALFDKELTPAEFRMLAVLYSFRDQNMNTVWPKAETIAARAGYTKRSAVSQVARITSSLQDKGWLCKRKKHGPRSPKNYELTVPSRLVLDEKSQVDYEGQVDNSVAEETDEKCQVDHESQVDNFGDDERVNLAETHNSQLDPLAQVPIDQTSIIKPLPHQYSEPNGSASGDAQPVENSLQAAARFYDSPTQKPDSPGSVFSLGVSWLVGRSMRPEDSIRKLLGSALQAHGMRPLCDALVELICRDPEEPVAYFFKIITAQRKPMPPEWSPTGSTAANLMQEGLPRELVRQSAAYFKLWVTERGVQSDDFQGWFYQWCLRDSRNVGGGLPGAMLATVQTDSNPFE